MYAFTTLVDAEFYKENKMQELRSVLEKHGFHFKKQFGQNFISDGNLLRSIVEASGITKETTVVEIGCGAGTLTRALAEAAKQVYAFDIDRDLQPVLAETLAGLDNVEVIFRDFNKLDLKAFEKEIEEYTVVANLPYYITTPLVTKLLEESDKVQGLSIMVQEEVADRFCAKENTPEYGSITAAIALKGKAKVVKRVSRNMFFPRPNVDSAVVKIEFERGRIEVKDERAYRQTVKCAFLNRRKTLENNLVNFFKLTREEAKAALAAAGVDEKARGETLSPERLAKLSDVLLENGWIK
ncbi:MAG: 16S rRNA (adenine(1518)-N(6)/adenine(1519)-N(6))-dimethyltransferase RsmA [Clostridia bacterium]|nr:16S rRNA (adenine(1518)-N(6)/adenine(1519)-N(6))-dimethyltransferase RsmA [Clostridia bacterium]